MMWQSYRFSSYFHSSPISIRIKSFWDILFRKFNFPDIILAPLCIQLFWLPEGVWSELFHEKVVVNIFGACCNVIDSRYIVLLIFKVLAWNLRHERSGKEIYWEKISLQSISFLCCKLKQTAKWLIMVFSFCMLLASIHYFFGVTIKLARHVINWSCNGESKATDISAENQQPTTMLFWLLPFTMCRPYPSVGHTLLGNTSFHWVSLDYMILPSSRQLKIFFTMSL